MAKQSAKQRQKSLQRKRDKRKRKQKAGPVQHRARSMRGLLRTSSSWPLHECWIAKEWQEEGAIVQVVVSRLSSQGQVAAGVFLVDLGCLGVKNAFGGVFDTRLTYAQELREHTLATQEMIECSLDLAAKVIRDAVAYARDLGFSPHRDYRDAMLVLSDANPDACDETVPLGMDGKPFFVSGPYDNVDRIMAKLTRRLGPDGFHFMAGLEVPDCVYLEDED